MVDRPGRKLRQGLPRLGDLGIALMIRIPDDRIGVRDVEIVADQRHPERRMKMVEEHTLHLRLAVAIRVAQQRDAVACAGVAAGGCPRLHPFHDEVLWPLDRLGPRRLGLDHQDVAIGERIERPRMLQAGGERIDLQAVRHLGLLALLPSDHGGDVHRRHQILLERRQVRTPTDLCFRVRCRLLAAACEAQPGQQRHREFEVRGIGQVDPHQPATPTR